MWTYEVLDPRLLAAFIVAWGLFCAIVTHRLVARIMHR